MDFIFWIDLPVWSEVQNLYIQSSQRYFNRKYLMNLKHRAKLKNLDEQNKASISELVNEGAWNKVSLEVDPSKEYSNGIILKPLDVIQINPLLLEIIQLTLTGKTVLSSGSFKIYK